MSNHENDDGMLLHDIDGCTPERNKSPSLRPPPPQKGSQVSHPNAHRPPHNIPYIRGSNELATRDGKGFSSPQTSSTLPNTSLNVCMTSRPLSPTSAPHGGH